MEHQYHWFIFLQRNLVWAIEKFLRANFDPPRCFGKSQHCAGGDQQSSNRGDELLGKHSVVSCRKNLFRASPLTQIYAASQCLIPVQLRVRQPTNFDEDKVSYVVTVRSQECHFSLALALQWRSVVQFQA